jgi:O-antigen ligase/polysaccharide polymerase Wzy-like membrane protein
LSRLLRFLFFASLFTVTFEKLTWNVAGAISIADVTAILFLIVYAIDRINRRDGRFPRGAVTVFAFTIAFLLVYFVGYYNLTTSQGEAQFAKGLFKFVVHFLFLVAGIAYLSRKSERFYWQSLGVFAAGMVFNGAYGVVQLLAARSGVNLDSLFISKITGGTSNINIYGRTEGGTQAIFRTNALTADPNHLGIFLVMPLLILAPIYMRLERGHRLRKRLALVIAFLLLVEIATLSRSGLLGLLVGVAILAFPYRRKFLSRTLLAPLGIAAAVLGVVVLSRLSFFETIFKTRVQTGGNSTSAHFGVYDFVPTILHSHPLFGLGLNNFSVYYQLVTGKTNWGPHSFYVALIVETGLVGTALFAVFLWYLFRRLRAARAIGRGLAAVGDATAARVRPLAWGLTAALAGTMAANVFYLTMSFYYFFAFAMLALAAPIVFARRLPAVGGPPRT